MLTTKEFLKGFIIKYIFKSVHSDPYFHSHSGLVDR